MDAFTIYVGSELKEEFSYQRPLNEDSIHALIEYAKATYGESAELRRVSREEKLESDRR